MDYISTKEAAARWGVSPRAVQRLLAERRVAGAVKYGNYWMVPEGASKPRDPRRAKKTAAAECLGYTPALALSRVGADAAFAYLEGDERAAAEADLAYRRGDPRPAAELWKAGRASDKTLLAAASLAMAAAISAGDYALYYDVERALERRAAETTDEKALALLSLPKTLAVVSMAIPEMAPEWLRRCDFSLFSLELRPFLLYLYALHLRNTGERAALLTCAQTALALIERPKTFTWLDVYFGVLGASAACALGDIALAERMLLAAMDIGLPYGFIAPFADSLGDFGGLMESCLERRYPQYLSRAVDMWGTSFKNWMRLRNEFTAANITTVLSAREYHIARLLAGGETYAGAARRLGLSAGRVKNIASEIYSKLYVKNRDGLRRFIL